MDEKITMFQNAKNCVTSASDHPAMKICHEALRKAQLSHVQSMKEHHRAEIDERIKRLQDKKDALEKK